MSVVRSVATEWPSYVISAHETQAFLRGMVGGQEWREVLRQVDALGVETRCALGPLRKLARGGGIEARNARYAVEAVDLAMRAATRAMHSANVTIADIDRVIVSSSTGYMMPSLADHLAARLGVRANVDRLALTGLGCAGSMRALALARRTDDLAEGKTLVVSVELCSVWLQTEEPSPEDVVSAMTFGDGAAAAIVGGSGAGVEIVASESVLWPSTLNARGGLLTSTGFRHVASPALPLSVLRNLRASVIGFLGRNGVQLDRLGFILVNPRNERLLAAMAHVLGIGAASLTAARHVWQARGNTLSVGPLYMLQVVQHLAPPDDGGLGLMVVLGPGVCCELLLVRWRDRIACDGLEVQR